MTRTLFVADTHFGHRGILSSKKTTPRPFADIAEHDETLIACWNAAVRRDDIVWHLGDFAFACPPRRAAAVFDLLNGRKFLIRGNHDEIGEAALGGPIRDVARVHVQDPGMREARGVWLSHYAHRTWPFFHRGDLHLYGHSHGTLPPIPGSLDVGVDCWGWTPVTLAQIQTRLAEHAAGGEP